MVLEFSDAAKACAAGADLHEKVANAFEKDVRAQLVKELGGAKAAKVATIDFKPQFCSPVGDGDGKLTGRHGIAGFVTVTGAPDLVDDALKVVDRETVPAPLAEAAMCGSGNGGSGCRKHGVAIATAASAAAAGGNARVAAADAAADDAGNTVTYSPLLQGLVTYLASGFNILEYDPAGAFDGQQTTSLDVSNWLEGGGKIYDLDTIAAACAGDSCFSLSSACATSLSTSRTASTAERQNEVFATVSASGEYLGITASASAGFRTSQSTMQSSDALSITAAANCNLLTFNLPLTDTVKYSKAFVNDVASALDVILSAKTLDPDTVKTALASSLANLYNNYGTHIPLSIGYGGFMRLELLMETAALKNTFNDESKLEVAVSHAVADLTASGGATSTEAKELFSSTSSYSYVTVPQIPSVELTAIAGGGYTIDPQKWTAGLSGADKNTLYASVINTKGLAELFQEASVPGSNAALRFGGLTSDQAAQLGLLSKAYLAYLINDSTQWPAALPMPPLLQNPNYFKDGACVQSPLIVRVDTPDTDGAPFKCVTCLRNMQTLPTDPSVSLSNPDTTTSCYTNGVVKSSCTPCLACNGVNVSSMCKYQTISGVYATPATCDDCVQCTNSDTSACSADNNRDNYAGGHGDGDPAVCQNNQCVQCNANQDCNSTHCCDLSTYQCTVFCLSNGKK
jgi:hypothetical protein